MTAMCCLCDFRRLAVLWLWPLRWQDCQLARGLGTGVGRLWRFGCRSDGFESGCQVVGVVFCCLGRRVVDSCGTRSRDRRVALCYFDFWLVFLLNWPITRFLIKRLCSCRLTSKRIHKLKLSDVEEKYPWSKSGKQKYFSK
jgi:hypothetical protein